VGGDGTGHCQKNIRMYMCLILNGCRLRAVWIHIYTSTVDGNKWR